MVPAILARRSAPRFIVTATLSQHTVTAVTDVYLDLRRLARCRWRRGKLPYLDPFGGIHATVCFFVLRTLHFFFCTVPVLESSNFCHRRFLPFQVFQFSPFGRFCEFTAAVPRLLLLVPRYRFTVIEFLQIACIGPLCQITAAIIVVVNSAWRRLIRHACIRPTACTRRDG